MKKWICILFALTMLWAVALAEDTATEKTCNHQFQVQDELLPEHEWCIADSGAPAGSFLSVVCSRCGEDGVVFSDASLIEPDPCDPSVCTHRIYCPVDFADVELSLRENVARSVTTGHGTCVDCDIDATLSRTVERKDQQVTKMQKQEPEAAAEVCVHALAYYAQQAPYREGCISNGGVTHVKVQYYRGVCLHCGEAGTAAVLGEAERHTFVYSGLNQHLEGEGRHEYFYRCTGCGETISDVFLCYGSGDGDCPVLVTVEAE